MKGVINKNFNLVKDNEPAHVSEATNNLLKRLRLMN